jgi:hypothetical protein
VWPDCASLLQTERIRSERLSSSAVRGIYVPNDRATDCFRGYIEPLILQDTIRNTDKPSGYPTRGDSGLLPRHLCFSSFYLREFERIGSAQQSRGNSRSLRWALRRKLPLARNRVPGVA